mmetsp:Transcript_4872/g.31164  ORF Transcript_4872/g.31164 Transcript_4872/m.31164 type:complete len:209 (-) Transcript_4872:856-1482(-)
MLWPSWDMLILSVYDAYWDGHSIPSSGHKTLRCIQSLVVIRNWFDLFRFLRFLVHVVVDDRPWAHQGLVSNANHICLEFPVDAAGNRARELFEFHLMQGRHTASRPIHLQYPQLRKSILPSKDCDVILEAHSIGDVAVGIVFESLDGLPVIHGWFFYIANKQGKVLRLLSQVCLYVKVVPSMRDTVEEPVLALLQEAQVSFCTFFLQV